MPATAPQSCREVTVVMATPVLQEGRLLGALAVGTKRAAPGWGERELFRLELAAAFAAAVLVAQERAQLIGALLVVRTAQHTLNNQLALTLGYAELLAEHKALPPFLKNLALECLKGAEGASHTLARLQDITRISQQDAGDLAPLLDLERSTEP